LLNDNTLTLPQRNYIWSIIEFIDWGQWNLKYQEKRIANKILNRIQVYRRQKVVADICWAG
jgi:hypothetical protein